MPEGNLYTVYHTSDGDYDEIANEVGVSRKTISQKIKILKEKGIITRVGSAKKGYWMIKTAVENLP